MKTPIQSLPNLARLAVLVLLSPLSLLAQGTTFTYHGQLNDGAKPANGFYDVRFMLFDASAGGSQRGPTLTNTATAVSNGVFIATLDFGNQFPGASRWLEIAVRTNGNGGFSTLNPRQALTPTPYAITAGNLNGALASANLGGTYANALILNNAANSFSGNGANLTALNASQLTTGTVADGRLSTNVPLLNANQILTGSNNFAGPLVAINGNNRFAGNGAGLTNLSAGSLTGTIPDARLTANVSLLGPSIESAEITDSTITPNDLNLTTFNPTFWRTAGNAGTTPGTQFLGTTDNQPLVFKVNGSPVLQLFPDSTSPNVVGGYALNRISPGAHGSTIGGGGSGPFAVHLISANYDTIGGGLRNIIDLGADNSTIAGGVFNSVQSPNASIGGGNFNLIQRGSGFSTIAGGDDGLVGTNSAHATVAGGESNYVLDNAAHATIGGGNGNLSGGTDSTIAGGAENSIQTDAAYSTIGGGQQNTIQPGATWATIPGGFQNSATAAAFAAGKRAKADHTGSFVWADSTDADFASTAINQFNIRASGGVRLSESTPNISFGSQTRQMINLWRTQYGIGVQDSTFYFRTDNASPNNGFAWYGGGVHNDGLRNPGGGVEMMRLGIGALVVNGILASLSDRNAKENIETVDARSMLDKVVALPVSSWNYKTDSTTRHIGPMAQDFQGAFAVGADDKHITTTDAAGVALAAIQGLNQKVEEKEAHIAELERRLEKLERLIQQEKGVAQ